MPDRKPNYFARVLAVLALITAFMLVVFTLVTTDGSSDDGGDDDSETTEKGPTRKGERALESGVWVVGEGDTLVSISEETGIDIDELTELNSDIDPQTLSPGQRIKLDESAGSGSSSGGEDQTPGPDGTGVGDEGPTDSPAGSGLGDDGPSTDE